MMAHSQARDILAAFAMRYAQMVSYSDRGEVRTMLAGGGEPQEISFSTLYSKPNLFRFECSSTHPFPPLRHLMIQTVVGCDGERAYSLSKSPGENASVTIESSLSAALNGAAAVSGGSARTISSLFLAEQGGFGLPDLVETALTGEQEHDGVPCYVIVGKHPQQGSEHRLWVQKSDLVLTKLTSAKGNVLRVQTRTAIVVDEPINQDQFRIPQELAEQS